jgi:tetratricopeptide (TPR) repeat protein
MNVARALAAGVESLQQGRLKDAAAAFLEILRAQPQHPGANYLLAQTALLAGDLDEAAWRASLAAQLDPGRAEFHVLVGNVAQRRGEPARAEAAYREALRTQPGFAEAQLNLGNVLDELGRTEEALAAYASALALKPDLLPAGLNRAALLARSGRAGEARHELALLRERFPRSAELACRRARLAEEAGDAEAALDAYRAAVELDARDPRARYGLARLLAARGEAPAALAQLEHIGETDAGFREAQLLRARVLLDSQRGAEALRALARMRPVHPGWTELEFAWGDACARAGRVEEAIAAYDAVLAAEPAHFGARASRALLVGRRGDPAAALAVLEALNIEAPGNAKLLNGAGVQLDVLGRLAEAEARYEAALARDPDLLAARNNLSNLCLVRGDFARGWRHHGEKWRRGELARHRRGFDCPLWRGEPLAGKSLFVWSEQGMGDQVMFASQFPDLAAQGVAGAFECSPRLLVLFQRSFPGSVILPRNAEGARRAAAMAFDFHAPMSALCEYLRGSWEAFPQHRGYLRADPARREAWRGRFAALGSGLKVGISWRGGTATTGGAARSSDLALWRPLLEVPGVRFVNLQYGNCAAELAAERAAGRAIAHWPGAADDLDEAAAMVSELDLVVSVCTIVIHVAGALGSPVWVLVPARPGWRYLLEGERLPWYPSARLLRQAEPGRWAPVISAAARALSERTSPAAPIPGRR